MTFQFRPFEQIFPTGPGFVGMVSVPANTASKIIGKFFRQTLRRENTRRPAWNWIGGFLFQAGFGVSDAVVNIQLRVASTGKLPARDLVIGDNSLALRFGQFR